VYHVASPLPYVQPKDPDELIVPAREGVLRVLRAARDAGAGRVVLTSSFAAIGYTPKPTAEFTEDDWTDPDTPGLAPYPRSKAIAERAAWDLMEHDGGDTELVVINPTFILGPTLTTPLAAKVPTEEAPGDHLPRPVIHNDRARNELGWRPRPTETTIVETAESLRDLGLLDDNADSSA
jgi:dihydroflavonol-4-reductase